MNVVVDAGNTRMKYAFFDEDRFVEARYCADGIEQEIAKRKNAGHRIHLLLSGSGRIPEEVRLPLLAAADASWEASPDMDLPLKIGYATPETLGFDRIAVCTGAMKLFPGHPL
ncbi:MAG: type III pantothenate kinase, partial [Odoribacter sp.]|nr:type III pantothenate kinase [Odoribacter sp.]